MAEENKKIWDSAGYTDNFSFVYGCGEEVINLITVPKGSFVVDLGCGNGALTQKLSEKGYKATGIDSSENMIAKAKELHPELEFILGDACSFKLKEKADAVFSNAVFHWISNHDRLVENIADNFKTGGQLVFEFGGKGCAQTVHCALDKAFSGKGLKYNFDFNFKTIGEFALILEKYGFRVDYGVLFDRPTAQQGENGLENWINMFVTGAFSGVDSTTKCDIIKNAVEYCRPELYSNGKWYVDYVRLRMKATKIQ